MPKKGVFKFDWNGLFADFAKERRSDPDLELKSWCEERNLNYSNTSRQFTELFRLQTGDKLSMLAPDASRKLGSLLLSKDETIAHKTATAILDRAGHSPQAQIINIQQSNQMQNQVTIPPMIQAVDAEDFSKMLEG